MKTFVYLSISMFCFLSFTSCHNDDIPELPHLDQAARDSIERVRTYKEHYVLSNLCDVEDQLDGSWRYTPSYGKILYSAIPTVRYVAVEDLEEAKSNFYGILVTALDSTDTVDMTLDDISYYIEGKGSLHFSASSDVKTQIASVKVDFPVVPNLREIVFIPRERWPHNDVSMLRYGAVYEDEKTKFRFVCIRDTQCDDGILITFDGKRESENTGYGELNFKHWTSYANWGEVQAKAATYGIYKDTKNDRDIYLKSYYGMSSYSDLYTLLKFLYYTDEYGKRHEFPEAKLIFTQIVDGLSFPLYPPVYNPDCNFLIKDGRHWERYVGWSARFIYYYVPNFCIINCSGVAGSMEFGSKETYIYDRTDWPAGPGPGGYIPSLSVSVDSSFDPVEHGLKQIYP